MITWQGAIKKSPILLFQYRKNSNNHLHFVILLESNYIDISWQGAIKKSSILLLQYRKNSKIISHFYHLNFRNFIRIKLCTSICFSFFCTVFSIYLLNFWILLKEELLIKFPSQNIKDFWPLAHTFGLPLQESGPLTNL